MNEYETDPQRHEASSTEEPSHRPADASRDSTGPERGQSDTTTQFASSAPAGAPASAASTPTSSLPASAAPAPGTPASVAPITAIPASGQPGTTAVQPAAGQTSPWQGGQGMHGGRPGYHPQPGYGQPYGTPGQGGYGPQPPYPGQQFPGQGQSPYAGQPQPGQSAYAAWTGAQTQAGHPQAGHPQAGEPEGQSTLPPWAQPVGTEQPREPRRTGGGRRILVTTAAAVLLALGAGGVGAYTALAFDDDGSLTTTQAGSSSVTRVVDRSSLAQIASAVQDSVVSIATGSGEGSGVLLTAEGYVLTNNHVVAGAQGNTVKVVFADGTSANATIVGTDPRTDLAVVKADGVSGLKPATFGKSADMQVGDTVLALGSPLGLEGSVTAGIISAKDRTIRSSSEGQQDPQNPFGGPQQQQPTGATSMSGLLQTDAPINPGNSGGALVNTNGEVIGINTAILSSGSGSGNIGLGFAIPSDKARLVADQLMKGQKVSHPALGVSVAEVEGGGAAVNSVTPGSAAAKAGLQQGDVITKVNDKPINDSDDLVAVVQSGNVGDTVSITFSRNGAQKTVNATLAEAS